MQAITMLDVGAITVADDNLREELGDITELAASIRSMGILEPLLVNQDGHQVVAGARRLEAAKRAGLKQVPAIVRAFTEQERLEVMIVENLMREDIRPLEEAEGFMRLREMGLTQAQIAGRVGCNQSHISKRLSLLDLPEPARQAVSEGTVPLATAQTLSKLADDPQAIERIIAETVRTPTPNDAVGYAVAQSFDAGFTARQIDRRVNDELAAKERAKAVDKKVKELRKAGEKNIIPVVNDGFKVVLPKGIKQVHATPLKDNDISLPPAEHLKCDCHAVGVNPRDGLVLELCTNPKAHPSRADREQGRRQKQADEEAKRAAQIKAARERRREFLTALCKGTVDKALLLELVFHLALEGGGYGWEALALRLLDLSPADKAKLPDTGDLDMLVAHAEQSQAARLRATMAMVLAQLETRMPAAALRILVERGYEPTDEERARVEREAKTQAALAS